MIIIYYKLFSTLYPTASRYQLKNRCSVAEAIQLGAMQFGRDYTWRYYFLYNSVFESQSPSENLQKWWDLLGKPLDFGDLNGEVLRGELYPNFGLLKHLKWYSGTHGLNSTNYAAFKKLPKRKLRPIGGQIDDFQWLNWHLRASLISTAN